MDWSSDDEVRALVARLRTLKRENEWVEFKVNNVDPEMIGRTVSALANSAALASQDQGFLIWGVEDEVHAVVGTRFRPHSATKGAEELQSWLLHEIDPHIDFSMHEVDVDGNRVVVLRVAAASKHPVKFKHVGWVRVGSSTKPLNRHPEHERRLWEVLGAYAFEEGTASGDMSRDDVLQALDYPAYFHLHGLPLPSGAAAMLEALEHAQLILHNVENQWQITNAGALMYARDLRDFPNLARKAGRVVQYQGASRVVGKKELVLQRGYAVSFQDLVAHVAGLLPASEVIPESGLRLDVLQFPQLAIRELVANALIHQDLTVTGAGPMIEVFDDRLEVTNPGRPLLDPQRFIDLPPRSRNDLIGREMRLIGVAEERGSGWDKIAFEIELHQLPPALIEVSDSQTRVTLFAPQPLTKMGRADRVRAVYQHACLRYVSNEATNNASVRKRFGIAERNKAAATRIIKEAVQDGLVSAHDPNAGPRSIRYVPFSANPESLFVDEDVHS